MRQRWVGVLGTGAAMACIAIACSDDPAPVREAPDAAKIPPGTCTLSPSPTPLCVPGSDTIPDAGPPPADASDAGTDGASGAIVAPPSENRCLLTYDRTLDCPSVVGPLSVGGGQLVVTQRGISPGDYQAYPQLVAIDATGQATITNGISEPYSFNGYTPSRGIGLVGDPPSLVFITANDENGTTSTLRSGAASISVPAAPFTNPYLITAPSGEGFFASLPPGGAGPLVFVRGLPNAPRLVPTTATAQSFVVTVDSNGDPTGLFQDPQTVRLLEGETFAKQRWSAPTSSSAASTILELAYSGSTPVIAARSGTDEAVVYWLHTNDTTQPMAKIGQSFSTCPRPDYLGITCDACPVGQQCFAGEDNIVASRMFSRGSRVFLAYVAHDTRRTLTYTKHTVPVIGVGCSCVLDEVSRQLSGDSLIVVEILDGGQAAAPLLVERMRLPLTSAGVLDYTIRLGPRADGDLDVVLGPAPAIFGMEGTTPPGPHPTFRVLRISTASIP